jgi:hypothetical protein
MAKTENNHIFTLHNNKLIEIMKNLLAVVLVSSAILMSCNNNETTKNTKKDKSSVEVADSTVIRKGKSIAMGTFKTLGSKLKKAIKKGGPTTGIDVCSSQARKLTDSMSTAYNVKLKRVSLKNRNENNLANETEKSILESWQTEIDNGNPIKPKVLRADNNEITFVAPIKVKHQCIVCHGTDDFVSSEVRLKLKEHYPNDKARNYKKGDLRGAWVITFPKDYFKK